MKFSGFYQVVKTKTISQLLSESKMKMCCFDLVSPVGTWPSISSFQTCRDDLNTRGSKN